MKVSDAADDTILGTIAHWRIWVAVAVGATIVLIAGIAGNAVVTNIHSGSAVQQERVCVQAGKTWQNGNCR